MKRRLDGAIGDGVVGYGGGVQLGFSGTVTQACALGIGVVIGVELSGFGWFHLEVCFPTLWVDSMASGFWKGFFFGVGCSRG